MCAEGRGSVRIWGMGAGGTKDAVSGTIGAARGMKGP